MKILKQIYSDIFKDIFKLIVIFVTLKKFNNHKKKKLIMINNQYHEDFSWINYIVGNILKEKGFNVKFIVCDGNSYCERMIHTIRKPNCKICRLGNILKLKSFNHDYVKQDKIKNKKKILKKNVEIKKLFKKLIIDNINFSLDFKTSFMHYFKGLIKITDTNFNIVNKIYSTLFNTVFTVKKIIKNHKPIKIVTINGKNIQTGVLYNMSIKNNIDCYTWDVFQQGFKGIISKNSIAHEQHISQKIWKLEKTKKIEKSKQEIIKNFMYAQSKSLNTPYKYYDENIIKKKKEIFDHLKIDCGKKIITIFPNTDWDSSTLGLDDAYDDQYHFIHEMIKFSKKNQDYTVIIRCHPGEQKVSYHAKSSKPLHQYIKENYNNISSNLKVIDSLSNISSYTLAQLSDHRIIYTSTLGLEFSYIGLKTLVVGNAYYKFKGFTCDVKTHNELLNYLKYSYKKKLSKTEHNLLKKFIFLSKFKRLFQLDYFKNHKFSPSLIEITKLNENYLYNNIANFILDKRDNLDLSK